MLMEQWKRPQFGKDWGSGRGKTTGTSAALEEKAACGKNRPPKPLCPSVKAAVLTPCTAVQHCCSSPALFPTAAGLGKGNKHQQNPYALLSTHLSEASCLPALLPSSLATLCQRGLWLLGSTGQSGGEMSGL